MPNPPPRGMALAIFILTSPVLAAEVVVLSAVADTSLFEFDPEYNFGRQRTLPAGSIGNMADANGARSRALYKFDVVGVIPPGSAIQSAVMALAVSTRLPSGRRVSDFALSRVLVSWGEGDDFGENPGGREALEGEATWNNRMHPRTPWSSPGGAFGVDYALDSSATATNVDGNGVTPTSYRFVFNGTGISDLELMINGTFSNFGWVLHTLSEGMQKTARRWVSRETINEGPAPELEITYTLPPIPPPLLVSVELDDVAQELCVRVNGGRADSARQTRWIGQVRSRSRSRRAERGTSREDWCRNGAHIREYRPERDIRREDWGFSRSEPRKGWIWSSFPPRRAPHQSRHGGKSVPGGEGAGCGGEAKLFAYCSSGSVSAASFGPPRTFSSLLGLTAGQGLGSKTKV